MKVFVYVFCGDIVWDKNETRIVKIWPQESFISVAPGEETFTIDTACK
jgi:hypothetical protein